MVGLGFDRITGSTLDGFDHVKQSLSVIFSTPIGSRVMRRNFGCELFDLIDRPISDKVMLAAYASIVYACAAWEPRFEITQCNFETIGGDGIVTLSVTGNYYPRGHLGDKSVVVRDVPLSLTIEKQR